MRRRALLAALGGLTALGGCSDTPRRPTRTTTTTVKSAPENGSFEAGLAGWTVGSDLPPDPRKTTGTVDATVSVTTETASDGAQSLALSIDGRQDDGTLWVQQPVDLTDAATLAVDYRTVRGGANTVTRAALYAGPERTLAEADFEAVEPLERPEGGDWETFRCEVDHDGPGLVAAGITVSWESRVERLIDHVALP